MSTEGTWLSERDFLLINERMFVLSQGSPTKITVSQNPEKQKCLCLSSSVSLLFTHSSFSPLLLRRGIRLTHNLPALVYRICGEAFGGRRHTSKPAFASMLSYDSLSLTCLKSMYLHGFEGYKQSRAESQGFV